ncbi:hypothetical protein [Tautonia sociabilis]|uniref:Glycosyltransferase RgtA/B/C/D-like domain-containing protein n=1 Tax=Tautonia sociabilis TaxID=2080755 RepID=A0A432MKC6_9BACT|nr:hypothetical protein [Tautonia sociabilis]RUL87699.1 hypothetical protein TsocGM_10965 [Tautonia sociabilis]
MPLPDPEPGASWFCGSSWLAMTVAAVWLIARFGPEVPLYDDFAIVPALVGNQEVSLGYLWSMHNEHRLPLPRLVLLLAYPAAGYDFRAGMFGTVACLSASSALLIGASRRFRGGSSYADAVFPIALLHFGHFNNLLWSWQIQFGLSTMLGLWAAALLAGNRGRVGPGTLVTLGVLLAMLPLCGANGLAMVPPLAAWLVGVGIARLRKKASGGWGAIAASVPGVALTAFYFVNYDRPRQIDRASSLGAVVRTGVQFLSIGLGPTAGEGWRIAGGLVLLLAIATAAMLVAVSWRKAGDRASALGLLAVLVGFGLLCLGLAWGRAGGNDRSGLEPRYVTLSAPIPILAALAWARFGSDTGRRLVPMTILSALLLLLWPNSRSGLDQARARKANSDTVLAEIRSGVPPFVLAARHSGFLHSSHDELATALPMLGAARLGVFRDLKPDPPMREIPITSAPDSMVLARWEPKSRTIEATGVDPWATFTLPERTWVAGIRIRYDHENGSETSARFKLGWRRSDQSGFPTDQQYDRWTLPTGKDRSLVVWIAGAIDAIRIQPDNRPSRFRVKEMSLLVPE